ncbi:hypothetical protein ACMHYJ_10095 [Castellaniella hirudinis]|uniref:hypothetical protein n=1 Tax=Castellaniella hirudinis TaxID=1144617 RepID=UPI0039C4D03C
MLAALWGKLQGWALVLGAAVLVLAGAYAAGGRAAKRSAQLDRMQRDLYNLGVKNAVDRKMDALDDAAVRDRARKRLRDSQR